MKNYRYSYLKPPPSIIKSAMIRAINFNGVIVGFHTCFLNLLFEKKRKPAVLNVPPFCVLGLDIACKSFFFIFTFFDMFIPPRIFFFSKVLLEKIVV